LSGIGLIFINDLTGNSTGSVVIFAVRKNYSMLFTPFPRTGNTSQMIRSQMRKSNSSLLGSIMHT